MEVELGTPILTGPSSSYTGNYGLHWSSLANATSYQLQEAYYVEQGPDSFWAWYHAQNDSSTLKTYEDKMDDEYRYRVRACASTCSDWSNVVTVNVLPQSAEGIVGATGLGSLPYRTGVTKGGDAYVNVPIMPVPGVNGLEPRLSIDYGGGRERQQSDEHLPADGIGYGWRVGGVSTIRRCVKGTDDTDGIDFDDDDALCLDGEPLTLISGSDTHLEGGAEYRTTRERFAEVVLKEDPFQDWFEVRLPDGTVREYGRTADSQLWVLAQEDDLGQPARAAAPFLWSINRQTDAFGNVMTYHYYEVPGTSTHFLSRVVYGDGGDATIQFVYRPRADLPESVFLSPEWRQLVYIHVRFEEALVRDYRLGYETENDQTRPNALQMCGYDPLLTEHCLEPLEIDWTEPDDAPAQVKKLTDPMGLKTTFTRETLTEDDAHTFLLDASVTPFDATSLPPNTQALPAWDGNVKSVVTKVSRSDGIGGTRDTSYAYLGRGVESKRNWGFLGFHAMRKTDSASGIVTYTQYRFDYPHFGRPAAVHRYDGNYASGKTPLSQRTVHYAEQTVSHAGSTATTTLPYAQQTTEWHYEGSATLGATQATETLTLSDGLLTSTVRKTQTAHRAVGDDNGSTVWGDGQSHELENVQRTTEQTQQFENDATDWVLGFANDIKVNHYAGSGTLDRTEHVKRTRESGKRSPDVVTRFPDDANLRHKTDYAYDAWGNRTQASEGLTSTDDRVWDVLSFRAGRYPTSWQNPLDHRESATHHGGLGVAASTTDANGHRTSFAYDGLGRETSRTRDWDSVTTTTTYASCALCAAVTAPSNCGNTVKPVMRVRTEAPDMPTTTVFRDAYGRAIRTAVKGFDGTDRRTDVFYDAHGHTVCKSEPYHAGDTPKYTLYQYDIRDRLTRTTRPDGGVTEVIYTGASNQVTETVTETVNASDGTTTRETQRVYNVLRELTSTTEAVGTTEQVKTSYGYDGAGRLEKVTTGGQTTTFTYDDAGNRTSVTNPDMGATVSTTNGTVSVEFEHNGYGELTEHTDARGATYYGYDELGRLECAADRDGTATWDYDPANGYGLLERRGYDRDTTYSDADSCTFGTDFEETYTYNGDARLTGVQTSIVDDTDATTPLTRSHSYDSYGRLSSTTYPSGVKVDYEYNLYGYLAKLKHGSTALVEIDAQTAYGQSKQETYGNGVTTTREFDALGRLKEIETALGATKIQNNTYGWRSDGSLEHRIAGAAGDLPRREETFDDDYLNRLTAATTGNRTLSFDYDLRGNLEQKTSTVTADIDVTSYALASGSNRLSSAVIEDVENERVTHNFIYDSSGHITHYDACSDGAAACADADDTFIEWNARGLATEVTLGAADPTPTAREVFFYGPDGARYFRKSVWKEEENFEDLVYVTPVQRATITMTVTKTTRTYYAGAYEKTVTVGGDTVERTRIGDSVVHVKTVTVGGDTVEHVKTTPESASILVTNPVATTESAFEYLHRDHLGSVEAVTDADGNELVVLGHDPYGERRKSDWTAQLTPAETETLRSEHGERVSRGFTGHEHLDRTGLVHMNGRVYDPRLGRFLSPDPIAGDPTSSQSWNLYSYVGNNPLSYADPTGESAHPPDEVIVVTGRRPPQWNPWDDYGWWDYYWWGVHSSWNPYDNSWYGDSLPGSTRAEVRQTLAAKDKSVADQPADDEKWTTRDQHALEASKKVNKDDTGGLLDKLGIPYKPTRGFAAALYKMGGQYYLAFRGTQGGSLRNWWSNLLQAFGFRSSQYEQAIRLAEQVHQATGGNVTLVGHSLGGGLASAGSFATGARAITFNAAGLHSRYREGEPGQIRAHYIRGDPLSLVQDFVPFLPEAAGTRIGHDYTGPFWERHSYEAFPGR